jgi:hypothetical protein
MRRILCSIMLACFLVFPAAVLSAAPRGNPEVQTLKQRQKAERKAMKLKKQYMKQSMRSQNLPKAIRDQMKHQLQREQRALRQKQKDEMQDLKDRIRVANESQRNMGQ